MLELGFIAAVQASTKMSPYEMMYGVKARLPIDVAMSTLGARNPAAIDRALRMREATAMVRGHLARAQAEQARNASRRVAVHAVGDAVLLSTEGITLRGLNNKLASRFVGPFRVTAVVNANAYTLALPKEMAALHHTFNIDKLKAYRDPKLFESRPVQHDRPPPVFDADSNGDSAYEVESIVARRYTGTRTQYLVSWKGYPMEDSTWESRRALDGAPDILAEFENSQASES